MSTPLSTSDPSTADPDATPAAVRPGDLVALGLLAVVLRLPALLASRHLTFDDGVFGASAVAMRDGGRPFAEVFSSQGPTFLPLVALADLLGFHTSVAPRLVSVVAGVVVTVGAYLVADEIAGRRAGLVAAVLVTTAGSMLWVTGPIAADGPALAAATMAVWVSLRYRRQPTTRRAVAIGIAVGLALATKLMAAPVLVPVAWVLVAGAVTTRPAPGSLRVDPAGARRLVVAAGVASLFWLVPSALFGFAAVWDQAVTYHTEATGHTEAIGGRDPLANAAKVASTFADRDLVLALAAAGVLVGAGLQARRQRRSASRRDRPDGTTTTPSPWTERLVDPNPRVLVGGWLVANLVLLAYVHPLWRPHVSTLVVPVAVLVATSVRSRTAILVGALVLAPVGVWRVADYLVPGPYASTTLDLHEHLDRLPAGAQVISDEPGHVWRAGRRTPDDLVDASILRIESGRITSASLASAAEDPRVCALVVWSSVRFGSFADLGDRLAAVGYMPTATFGEHRVLYTRDVCAPEG